MTSILEEIAEYSRIRVQKSMTHVSIEEMREKALEADTGRQPFAFESRLKPEGLSFISEVKKASPSKGIIDPVFDYMEIAADYEAAGADCLSVLTEPGWFLGSNGIFEDIRRKCNIPMLRKDFTVSEYQIYEAKIMGADAVLLICALLDEKTLKQYIETADSLGLSTLVETHNENEIRTAVNAGARVIGVNNRNLKDFSVDFGNAGRLRKLIPDECIYVAESGVRGPEDIRLLSEIGASAVLMGEVLMRSGNKAETLKTLKEAAL